MSAIAGPPNLLTARRINANKTHRIERLYRCANGLGLGAVRDGVLTLGDDEAPWEIFTINEDGIPYGNSVGWVKDDELDRAVERLAAWQLPSTNHAERAEPNSSIGKSGSASTVRSACHSGATS